MSATPHSSTCNPRQSHKPFGLEDSNLDTCHGTQACTHPCVVFCAGVMVISAQVCLVPVYTNLASCCFQRCAQYPLTLIPAQGARAYHGCRICRDAGFHVYMCSMHALCSQCIDYACIQTNDTTHKVQGIQHMRRANSNAAMGHHADNPVYCFLSTSCNSKGSCALKLS